MAKIVREGGSMVAKKKTKTDGETSEGFKLPTEKTVPVEFLLGYIILLFGEKKIGKTTMLAEGGDKTFFAFFEPGGKALALFAHVFTKWVDFKLASREIVKSKQFNHVVVDTVDLAYALSEKYTYKKLGIEHASDEAYGKGWAAVRENFSEPIMYMVNNGIAVTFVSHADMKEVEKRDGSKYTMLMPTMPKQARGLVEGLVDIWAYYGYDGTKRTLTIQGDDHISAGHRLSNNFRTPTGEPVRVIDMGSSPAESWANFTAAFNNKYTPLRKAREEDEEKTDAPKKKVFAKLKK